jgi:UDP-N-acetylmuramoyl-L-alanyl-D-glutamate--2,6-diaminopimelate ligase
VATRFYEFPSRELHLIGITGTNGKTTVSYLCEAVLQAAGHKPGVIGTIDYRCGGIRKEEAIRTTPEASDLQGLLRWMRDQGAGGVVMEVSSHSLALSRVEGCAFDVAIFTNLTQDHLDFHGTMDQYFEAKARLFPMLKDGEGTAVINLDDPAGKRLRDLTKTAILTYGLTREADLSAEAATYGLEGIHARISTPWGGGEIRSPLLGRHNLYNLLAGVGAGLALRIPLDRILQGLACVQNVPGRLERVECGQPFTVVVDYAHTPDALERVLRTARDLSAGRLIVLFGCGGDRDRGKRPLMGFAAAQLADQLFLTSDNPRSEIPEAIVEEIVAGVRRVPGAMARVRVLVDRREAIRAALQEAQPGDFVLLAGKGHETMQIIGERKIPFDDRKVGREVLKGLGYSCAGS